MADILLFGATSVTSNLALRYLLNQQRQPTFSRDCTRRHFTLSIAIQSISELKDVLVSLGNLDGIEPIVLDPYNEAEVEKTIRRAKVVLNFMERNWEFSFGVIKACAANGVHYVGLSTEHSFVSDVIKRYDYLAYKHRAIILPSCGFNSLLSDIIVHISAKTLEGVNHPIEQAKSQWLPTVGIASSKTSFQLNLAGPGHGPCHALSSVMEACYEQPRVSDSLSPVRHTVGSNTRLVYSLASLPLSCKLLLTNSAKYKPIHWGSFSAASSFNKNIVMFSWGLLEREKAGWCQDTTSYFSMGSDNCDVHPSKESSEPSTYGPDFLYDEFTHAKGPVHALVASLTAHVLSFGVAVFPHMMWTAKRLLSRFHENPSEKDMSRSSLLATNITTSTQTRPKCSSNEGSLVVKTTVKIDYDPVYLGSAIMASEAALALLDTTTLSPLARHGGILTPATALGDVLVSSLSARGLWEIKSDVVI